MLVALYPWDQAAVDVAVIKLPYLLKSKVRFPPESVRGSGRGKKPHLGFEYEPGEAVAQLQLWPQAGMACLVEEGPLS